MKATKVLAIILVLLAGIVTVAADKTADYGVGKTRSVNFFAEFKIGNTVLPAGDYRVQHLMEGDNHVLVFKNAKNKEVARVNCKMVDLGSKSDQTLQEYQKDSSGARVLSALVFRGDQYKHQF